MSGKGSDRRPRDPKYCTYEEFDKRWNTIFANKKDIEEKTSIKEDQNET
jgi:hypothetical protein